MKIRELVAKFANAIGIESASYYDKSREQYLVDKKRAIRYMLTMCGFPITHLARYTGIDHTTYSVSNRRFDELLRMDDKRSVSILKKLLRVAREDIDLDWYGTRMMIPSSDAESVKYRVELINRLIEEIDGEDKEKRLIKKKNMEQRTKLLTITRHYGLEAQVKKFAEEAFELQQELIKDNAGLDRVPEVADEIADCLVLIRQFMEWYHFKDTDIEEIIETKIERTLKRMKEEER